LTAVATATVFDHALRVMLDAVGGAGAAVYLLEADRPVLKLAAAHGDRDAAGAPWAVETPWGIKGPVAEPVADVESDGARLTVPMLLGDDVIGAIVVSAGRRGLAGVDTERLVGEGRALARALAPGPLEALRAELAHRIAAPSREWLETQLAAAARGERDPILTAFPAMGRRLGREPLGSRSALVPREGEVEVPLRSWRIDDAGRVALLCAFTGDAEALARELYFTGDLRERCGALRGLAVLGRTPAAIDAVLDAMRTSAVELFEAALAENPYAGRFLPDDEFRHAGLKAAFIGVSIARLPCVEARADAELSRMLLSYVTEREVAGRSVPPDIWPVAALHPTPGLAAKLCGYLEHPALAHRRAAALALARIGDSRTHPFLNDRLAREDDPTVRRIIEHAVR
jgi:hypothetical protein